MLSEQDIEMMLDKVQQEIVAAPKLRGVEWQQLLAEPKIAGSSAEVPLTALDVDGHGIPIRALAIPFPAQDILDELRAQMYQPSRGTWFAMRLVIRREGATRTARETNFTYDDDPGFSLPWPGDFLEDQEKFPRSREHIPGWLNDLLERAVAEQVAAGERPSTAVPWLTGGTGGGGGRLARWGRSVAGKVTGRSGVRDGESVGASSSATSGEPDVASASEGGGLVAGAGTGAGTSVGAPVVPGSVAEVAALVPESLREAWLATAAPSVALRPVDADAVGSVARPVVVVGGNAVDLPVGTGWPSWRDRPFQLHAVVDCDAARALQPALALPPGRVALFTPPAGPSSADGPAGTAVVHVPADAATTTVSCPDGVPVLPRVVLAGTAEDSYDTLDLLALDLHTTDPDHPALAGLTGMAALTGTDPDDDDFDGEDKDEEEDTDGEGGVITDADELFETVSDALPPPDLAGRVGGWPDPTGSRPHQDLADAGPATTPPWTLLLQVNTADPGSDDVHYWLTPTSDGGSGAGVAVHHVVQH